MRQLRVAGDQAQAFGQGLSQEQAVEGIFVQRGRRSMLTASWLVMASQETAKTQGANDFGRSSPWVPETRRHHRALPASIAAILIAV